MEKSNDLTTGSISKVLIKFALPVLGALFLQAMYGAVDLFVVGQFASTEDISGVATGSMLMHTITIIISGLAMGVTILTGQSIGRKNYVQTSSIIGSSLLLFLVLSLLLTIFTIIFAAPLAKLMQAPKEAFLETKQYILICGLGSVFIIAYNLIGSVFRGLGDSKTPLITVIIACVANIIGDLLFVAVFKMGSAGAAIATIIAQAISVIISILFIKKEKLPFRIKRKNIVWNGKICGDILKLGSPIAFQDFLVGISFLVVLAIVNSFGLTVSAGVGVAEKVCAFLMLTASAFAQSISAFVAQNIGAQKIDRAKKSLFYGIGFSLCAGIIMFYISFFHGDLLASIFSTDEAVIFKAHDYLKAYAIDCIFTAIMFCFIGFYNGIGKTIFVMVQGLIGAFGVRIPVVLIMSKVPDVSLFEIGLATPASTVVQIILCLIYYYYINKKKNILTIKSV